MVPAIGECARLLPFNGTPRLRINQHIFRALTCRYSFTRRSFSYRSIPADGFFAAAVENCRREPRFRRAEAPHALRTCARSISEGILEKLSKTSDLPCELNMHVPALESSQLFGADQLSSHTSSANPAAFCACFRSMFGCKTKNRLAILALISAVLLS